MNTPKIRFKGFKDDWEQRKFSDLYVKVSEKNDLSFGADKIISVANMYFKQDIKESGDDYMKTYNVMRLGDIAFEGNKSKNYAHGRFVENTIGDGIVSHVFDVFRPIVDYDLSYWKYFINNEGIMGRIMARCTKSSTMMTNLVANDFLKEFVLVPALAEQKEIGEYFRNLDNLITLHQRKCCELKKLKQYMANHMFVNHSIKCDRDIATNHKKLQERTKEMGELESVIEQRLIDQLCGGDSQWTYRKDIRTEEQLWDNFKYILEQNNKAKLNDMPLSESEFAKIKNDVSHASFYDAGKWQVGENGKVYVHVQRGNETLHLVVMNNEHIAGGTSVYEVINQYQAFKTDEVDDKRDRRFDVTLLINGIPMIHIELKSRQSSAENYNGSAGFGASGKRKPEA